MNNESNGWLEGIGVAVLFLLILGILCVPGIIIYQHDKKDLREEIINELCNNGNGKYDFCELVDTTFYYKEVKKNSEEDK